MIIDDIANKLISLGYGTYDSVNGSPFGIDIWPYRFPPSPLNCICIIPLDLQPPLLYDDGDRLDIPSVQIQVRNTVEITADATADAIRTKLHTATISGYVFCLTTRSRPTDLTSAEDLEATDGPVYRFSVDFELMKVG